MYSGQDKSAHYQLDLKPENDFSLQKDTSMCRGKWMLMSTDSILLKCDNREVEEKLFKDYLIKKELVLTVKSQNQLNLGVVAMRKLK